jgi:NAD(P)H-dependent FMN reductase
MSKTKIGVIIGSTRLGRSSVSVVDWFIKEAEKYNNNYQYVTMDLKEYRLPFFGEKDPDNRTEL